MLPANDVTPDRRQRWHSGIGAGSSARRASPPGADWPDGACSVRVVCSRSSRLPACRTRSSIPVEVSGADAEPVMGKLPGQKRMYVLPNDAGEYHRVGSQVMKRIARREDTGDVHELATFTGNTGAAMPRHAHLSSHAAVLVMRGEIELELAGDRWTMMRGDFANLPPGTPHALDDEIRRRAAGALLDEPSRRRGVHRDGRTRRTDRRSRRTCRTRYRRRRWPVPPRPAISSSRPRRLLPATAVRVTNKQLPLTPGAYVLADGGGERFGGNTFLARNANTTGQFLFIITEGGPGGGVGAHFHARHFENFFALDGETLGWALRQGRAAAHRRLFPGAAAQSARVPPESGLQPLRRVPDAGHLRELLRHDGRPRPRARCAEGRGGGPPAGRGDAEGRGRGAFAGGAADMFRALQMSGRGPDGYPLDVHPAKLPLPPQDPIWTKGAASALSDRAALLAHAQAICGVPISREITPELRRALALKPRPEDFI